MNQREIKFRAWDKEEKKMGFVTSIKWNMRGAHITKSGREASILNPDDEDIEAFTNPMEAIIECEITAIHSKGEFNPEPKYMMQFTGLLDKSGKEMYEGDIVRGINEFFGKMKGVVEFNEYMFVLEEKDKERGSSLSSLSNNSDLEVIGNIYSNPELLK